jgi:hypothetical protein
MELFQQWGIFCPLSTILIFNFGIVPTVWYFLSSFYHFDIQLWNCSDSVVFLSSFYDFNIQLWKLYGPTKVIDNSIDYPIPDIYTLNIRYVCFVDFHGINSTVEISWDILRLLADYRLRHLVNNVHVAIYMITLEWR